MCKKCSKCGEQKALSEFYLNKKTGRAVAACKSCAAVNRNRWKEQNSERTKDLNRKWQLANPGRVRDAQKRWAARNPGVAAQRMREWRLKNLERHKANCRRRDKEIKDQVFNAYGGYVCNCCGETNRFFLSLDHINNDGAAHRRAVVGPKKSCGKKIYAWVLKNNFPEGFQILCMNCNFGKARNNGVCPHRTSEGSETIPKGSRAKRSEARSPA